MWEAIKWVSSGLTLAAFLAACYVFLRVKSLETDRDILQGADDEKKLPILQALRDRMPLVFNRLDAAATERLAVQELRRFRDRDKRTFILLLVALVLLACVIVLSIWRTNTVEESAKPAEARLAIEYARLFGAVETPIVVQIQSHGGRPWCGDGICNFTDPTVEPEPTPVGYEIQTGHFSPAIAEFWKSWPYKDALPVQTPLWKAVAASGDYGFKLLDEAQARLGKCVRAKLVPYDEDPSIPRDGTLTCSRSDSKRVGFLFLILKNISDRELRDLALAYLPLPVGTPVENYLRALDNDVMGAKKQTLAGLKPGQVAILLISVYDKDDNNFERKILADGMIPREIAFKFDGRDQAMKIRSPRREKALVAVLPNGWYLQ